MCLEIYTKQHQQFYLEYVPHAKAYTDVPGSLLVIIKQRRRWMNGSFYATLKVLQNFKIIISCRRTIHPWYRKAMMAVFLVYYAVSFLLSYFGIASIYVVISIFINQHLTQLIVKEYENKEHTFVSIFTQGIVNDFFDYVYMGLVLLTILIALAAPLSKA